MKRIPHVQKDHPQNKAAQTLHVVQGFEERDGGIVPVQPKVCPSAGSARAARTDPCRRIPISANGVRRKCCPDGYDPG
jgi:hypothetical protein